MICYSPCYTPTHEPLTRPFIPYLIGIGLTKISQKAKSGMHIGLPSWRGGFDSRRALIRRAWRSQVFSFPNEAKAAGPRSGHIAERVQGTKGTCISKRSEGSGTTKWITFPNGVSVAEPRSGSITERMQGTKIETFHVRCYVCNNPKEVSNGSPWRSLFD